MRVDANRNLRLLGACVLLFIGQAGCVGEAPGGTLLRHYPADNLHDIVSISMVLIDGDVSTDGVASLRIRTDQPATVRLYDTGDLDVEKARLIYRAQIRTEAVDGEVYLEMWCRIPGKGEFFSRATHMPLTGSTGWTSQETYFFLKEGENPDNIRLNLVVNGTGTVWIDDIRLFRGPLSG
jgi:hypothetical protein